MSDGPPETAVPRLVEMRLARPIALLSPGPRLAIAFMMVFLIAACVVAVSAARFRLPFVIVVSFVVFAVPFALAMWLLPTTSRRRVRTLLEEPRTSNPQELAELVLKRTVRINPVAGFIDLARFFAKRGGGNLAFRICSGRASPCPRPLDVPFEPLPLNEAEDAVVALDRLAESPSSDAAPTAANARRPESVRRLKRRIALAGGWLAVLFLALNLFNVAFQGLQAFQNRRFMAAYLPLMVPAILALVAVAVGGMLRQTQWWVMPGGLLRRKNRVLRSTWDVRLFDRRRSILLIVQQTRHQWLMAVADAEVSERRLITQAEGDFVIRAWLSPIDPPPITRLSDLM